MVTLVAVDSSFLVCGSIFSGSLMAPSSRYRTLQSTVGTNRPTQKDKHRGDREERETRKERRRHALSSFFTRVIGFPIVLLRQHHCFLGSLMRARLFSKREGCVVICDHLNIVMCILEQCGWGSGVCVVAVDTIGLSRLGGVDSTFTTISFPSPCC